jgi:hypothetical protein
MSTYKAVESDTIVDFTVLPFDVFLRLGEGKIVKLFHKNTLVDEDTISKLNDPEVKEKMVVSALDDLFIQENKDLIFEKSEPRPLTNISEAARAKLKHQMFSVDIEKGQTPKDVITQFSKKFHFMLAQAGPTKKGRFLRDILEIYNTKSNSCIDFGTEMWVFLSLVYSLDDQPSFTHLEEIGFLCILHSLALARALNQEEFDELKSLLNLKEDIKAQFSPQEREALKALIDGAPAPKADLSLALLKCHKYSEDAAKLLEEASTGVVKSLSQLKILVVPRKERMVVVSGNCYISAKYFFLASNAINFFKNEIIVGDSKKVYIIIKRSLENLEGLRDAYDDPLTIDGDLVNRVLKNTPLA